jgi:hypothetical protein
MICHNELSRYQEVKYSTLCATANIFGTIFIFVFVLIYVLFLMHMHCLKNEIKNDVIVKYNNIYSLDDILFGTSTKPKCLTDLINDIELKNSMKYLLKKLYAYDNQCILYKYDEKSDSKCANYDIVHKKYSGFVEQELYHNT